jgi:hypothetical protein
MSTIEAKALISLAIKYPGLVKRPTLELAKKTLKAAA